MPETGNAALALRPQMHVHDSRMAVAPRNLQDVQDMAVTVAKTGLYGVKSVEEAKVRMVTGMELGLSMMQSLRGVFVMTANGKMQPGLYADTMVGVCKSKEICEYFDLLESSAKVATYETKRRGEKPVRMSFTIDQAKQAGLASKDVWRSYPDAMLRARASSALTRAVYPDILNGLYSLEELRDMGPETVTVPPVEIVESQPLQEQLEQSIEQTQGDGDLFGGLMAALLDARSAEALDVAMGNIAPVKDQLSKEQLANLRKAAKECKKSLGIEATS